MARIILFNKPFRVLSQFTDKDKRSTLADYLKAPEFKVAGRLDFDSEGLLLLTDDGHLQQRIANPRHKLWKSYWVQVEGTPDNDDLQKIRDGLVLRDGPTLPAKARVIKAPPIWTRDPPIRQRQAIADSWLEISIREGRNRQVRRMTAAIGLPTLRLIRHRIGDWELDQLRSGEHRQFAVHSPQPAAPRKQRSRPQ